MRPPKLAAGVRGRTPKSSHSDRFAMYSGLASTRRFSLSLVSVSPLRPRTCMLRHHPRGRPGVPPSTAPTGKRPTPWPSAARVGHNLLLCLSTRKLDVLRFLTDPSVPFTNNPAEQDGRVMKLRQKISGGFRSEDGAKDFAIIRSVLSTARKQGWNMLQTLTSAPSRLIADLRLA